MIPNDWPLSLAYALETAIGVTALVVLVLFLRKPVAKRFGASAAYALWALPLIRLVLPPLPAGWAIWTPAARQSTETAAPHVETIVKVIGSQSDAPVEFVALPPAPPTFPAEYGYAEIATASPVNWPLLIASIWALGVIAALVMTAYRHISFMKVVDAEVEPASDNVQALAQDIVAEIGLRRNVRVCESLISSGPMVTGLARPSVILPVWFEDDYTPGEQRAAIAHELTHVKRHDLWTLQFAHVMMALQWFNPLARWALRAFRSDQEAACDADVLRHTSMTPRAYAATLVKAVKLSQPTRTRMMAAGLPLTHAIKDRLVLMQSPQPSFRTKMLSGVLTALIGSAALVATASAHPTGGKKEIHVNGITISDGELTIDGKTYEDRRFVLLDEPFDERRFQFEFNGEFEELGEVLAREGEALAEVFENLDIEATLDLEGLAELEELAKLEVLSELPHMITELVGDVEVTELEDGSTQIVIAKQKAFSPEKLAKLEAHAERMAQNAEAMVVNNEEFQRRMEVIEARAEEMSKRAEAHANAFAFKMEMQLEPTTEAINALAQACAEQEFSGSAPIVIEQKIDGEDRELKAVCVKGGQSVLTSPGMKVFLKSRGDLTPEQLERFYENSGSGQRAFPERDDELKGSEMELED